MRVVPAVITVNSLADTNTQDFFLGGVFSDNFLTFREAVQMLNQASTFGYSAFEQAQVNLSSPFGVNDEIRFATNLTASGPATIEMVNGAYQLGTHVKITGPGADKLSFDAGHNSRIFTIGVGPIVEINDLTLKNGRADDGGVIGSSGTLNLTGVTIQGGIALSTGGAIFNSGTLTLVGNTTISDSFAGTAGGAIENAATLRVNQSTLENNVAAIGGAINNRGAAIVTNSTFASNQAAPILGNGPGVGGAINNLAGGVTVINSTFFGNVAANVGAKGGAINNDDRLSVIHSTFTANTISADGGGAGIFGKSGATTRMFNSILVDNRVVNSTKRDDVSGQVSSDSFGNLTSQRANPAGLFSGKGNYLPGTSLFPAPSLNDPTVPFPTELANLFDPNGLQFNGGPTKTIALQEGSFAIDKGFTTQSPTGVALTMLDASGAVFTLDRNPKDQRGGVIPRAYRQPDLGATEFIPTTLVVDSLADNLDTHVPAVTLREAVTLANAIPGDNTITFGVSGTIRLTQGELALTDLVGTTRIVGPGPNSLAIDGNQTSRIFSLAGSTGIVPGAKAEIAGLTIQNGNGGAGGGIFAALGSSLTVSNATFKNNRSAGDGGGIFAAGTLTVGGSTFEGNVTSRSGGGIFAAAMGAGESVSVFNSTFLQNVANGAAGADLTSTIPDAVQGGGGIAIVQANARIENSTFTGNHAVGVGGGIAVLDPDDHDINIVHNTLTGNTVAVEPGSFFDLSARTLHAQTKGGGLFSQQPTVTSSSIAGILFLGVDGRVRVINTIVAGNVVVGGLAPADYGGPNFDGAYALSNGAVVGNGMVRDHSVIGGDARQILAGGLADLGGPTKTIALVNNSSNPALGKAAIGHSATDQRGFVRSATAPSIGAFEPGSTTILVTTRTDEDNGTISPNVGTGTSLREAIGLANSLSFPTTITFAANMTGVIELTQGALTLANPHKITIQGPGADKLALDGLNRSRILNVSLRAVAEVSGLTFRNGFSLANGGGAIENIGNLTLKNIIATRNKVDSNGTSIASRNNGGGAIANLTDGNLTIQNSTFDGNTADVRIGTTSGGGGGAISNDGRLIVVGSTFVSNRSVGDEGGGGIANYGTTFAFNSTFTLNSANSRGGALMNEGNLFLVNDTIALNFSTQGGVFTKGFSRAPFASTTAFNTIISGSVNGQFADNLAGIGLSSISANNLISNAVEEIFVLAPPDKLPTPLLADNGGPTKTIALKTGSPAIDAGTDLNTLFTNNFSQLSTLIPELATIDRATLLGTDQRGTGFKRVSGNFVDIGAIETLAPSQIAASAVLNEGVESVAPNTDLTVKLGILDLSNVTTENVELTMVLPEGTSFKSLTQTSIGASFTTSFNSTTRTVSAKIPSFPNGTGAFDLVVRVEQSAAGSTLEFSPIVTTTTFHTETLTPTLSVPVDELPPVPQLSSFEGPPDLLQTSVAQPVEFAIKFGVTAGGTDGPITVNPETITAADFTNTGTASFRIDSIEDFGIRIGVNGQPERVIVVTVTPLSFGTLRLTFSDNAEIRDTRDRPLSVPGFFSQEIEVRGPLVVSTTNDEDDGDVSPGNLSLREAVRLANEGVGSNTIEFAPNLGPITLTLGELELTDTEGRVTITGPNNSTQVIQRSTAPGTDDFRIFVIAPGVSAGFQSLTIANGVSDESGGGILNFGNLEIQQSTLRDNVANAFGGAIYNVIDAQLQLSRSTLSGNRAHEGGGIFNEGSVFGELSTISGNSARQDGGGFWNAGELTLHFSTVVLNQADSDGVDGGVGGGIVAYNVENLIGTIIAGNTRGTTKLANDIGGGFADLATDNVVGDNATGGAVNNGIDGNIVGINGGGTLPLANILDPALANNGGPTQTHALAPLSPARDAVSASAPETRSETDQRGNPILNAKDVGAFEYRLNTKITLLANTTIFVAEGKTLTLDETIEGGDAVNLTKTGPGMLILGGSNLYRGQTNINAGTVIVTNRNSLGTGLTPRGTIAPSKPTIVAAGASVVVDGQIGPAISEVLMLNGKGVNDAGALQLLNDAEAAWSGAITLASNTTIGVGTNSQLILSGVIAPGAGTATKGLTKAGSGQLVLTKANKYTGATTINAGELTINGSQPKSAIVLNGGTLSGRGITAGMTAAGVVNGLPTETRIAPGDNGISKLAVKGNLALNASTTFDVQIKGTTVRTLLGNVDVTGTVTLNNATLSIEELEFSGFTSRVGTKYQIITNDKTDKVVGTFNGLAEGAFLTINRQRFQITYKGGTGNNDVVLTHVNTNSAFRERSITTLVGENGLVTLQGTIVEADPRDRFKLTINWGDGRREVHRFPAGSDGRLVTLTHQYRNGRATPYDVFLEWEDQHGGGNTTHLSVQVSNVAPTVTISGPETFKVNQTKLFTFRATDPADQSSLMQWTIDWGDGTSETRDRAARFTRSHRYTEPGDYLIRATATDRDGLTSSIATYRVHVTSTINPASLLGDLLVSGQI